MDTLGRSPPRLHALAVLLCAVLPPTVRAQPPDTWDARPLLAWRSSLWSMTPEDFLKQAAPHGQRWNARRQAVVADRAFRFGELELRGAALRFRGRIPVRWDMTIHERALHGARDAAWLRAAFARATNVVQQWAESPPMRMERDHGAAALVWARPPHILAVEYDGAPDAADGASLTGLRVVAEPWPPRRDWSANVATNAQGDRWLRTLPMVAQATQGHCAPATVERVMRYYGIPLSQSTLARLAESSIDGGTNVERMLARIQRLRGLPCEVTAVFGFEMSRFERTLRAYNALAARAGADPLRWEKPILDLARVFGAADAARLRQAKARQTDRGTFAREIARFIDRGHPLVWGVVLGLVPEEGLSAATRGGHLRLIVGYNAQRHEVLFSDSWGRGHDLKRMTHDNAWTMTLSLHVIAPTAQY